MTNNNKSVPNKGGRPKKYDPSVISSEQQELISAILNPLSQTTEIDGVQIDLNNVDITEEMILNGLKQMALKGNVKAWELLGDRFNIFDKKEKEGLIDIFIDEGTLEQGIEKILLVLEDKYPHINADTILDRTFEDVIAKALKDDEDDVLNASNLAGEEPCVTPALFSASSLQSNSWTQRVVNQEIDIKIPEMQTIPKGSLSDDPEINPFTGAPSNREHKIKNSNQQDLLAKALARAQKNRKMS